MESVFFWFGNEFGTNEKTFHRDIKPEIKKDLNADPKFRKWLNQFGDNPDIGVDSLGNIVLRATNGKKPFAELITNLKLEWYLLP